MKGTLILSVIVLLSSSLTIAQNFTSVIHTWTQLPTTKIHIDSSTQTPSEQTSFHPTRTSNFQSQHVETSMTELPHLTTNRIASSSPAQTQSTVLMTSSLSPEMTSHLQSQSTVMISSPSAAESVNLSSQLITSSVPVSDSTQVMTSSMNVMVSSSSIQPVSASSFALQSSSSPVATHSVLMSTAMASNATTPLSHTVLVPSTSYDTTSIALASTQAPLNVTSSVPMSTAMMTSSVAPTTAKPTTPKPTPSGDVTLSYKHGNISCVTISGKITFDVTYITAENKTKTAVIDLTNKNLNSTHGKCVGETMENSTSMIKAQWEGLYEMSVTFTFGSDASWYVSKITFNATASQNPDFTNATEANYSATRSLNKSANGGYHASSNHSYLCESNEKLELSKEVSVHFEHIRMQPFDMKSGNFSNADVCGGDNSDSKPNSLVPIIVGCALAGLIVIVLIAYLVGRRKSSRGYQQV